MANKNFIANETRQSETHTITVGGSVTTGDTAYLSINSKVVTYIALAGDTTSDVASGLLNAIRQSPEAEFQQFGGQSTGTTDNVITLAAATPGIPITPTGSGSLTIGSTGTISLSQALVQANLSPADGSDVINWQGGVLPAAADTMYFESATFPMLYNLTGYAGLSFTGLYVRPGFVGAGIGLPEFNPAGYREYRGGRLIMTACPILNLQLPPNSGVSSFRFSTGATACVVYITGNGNPGLGNEPVDWIGTSGSSTVEVIQSGIVIANGFGEVALVDSIKGVGASVTLGSGVTVNSVNIDSSTVSSRCNIATLIMNNQSSVTMLDTSTLGTVRIESGRLNFISSGNITSLVIGSGGVADFSGSRDPITIASVDLNEGGTLLDPYQRCTFTTGVGFPATGGLLNGLVSIDLGTNLRINRSAY